MLNLETPNKPLGKLFMYSKDIFSYNYLLMYLKNFRKAAVQSEDPEKEYLDRSK